MAIDKPINKKNQSLLYQDELGILKWKKEKLDLLDFNPYPFFLSFISRIGKNKLIFWFFVLLLTVVFALINYATSYYEGTLYLSGGDGFSQDYVNWFHLGVIGLILITFKIFYNKIPDFFKDFSKSIDWNKYDPSEFIKIKKKSEDKIQGRGINLILLILFIIAGIFLSYQVTFVAQIGRSYDIWHSLDHPFGFTVYAIYNFITLGLILPVLAYQYTIALYFIMIKVPKKLADYNAIQIRPLAADNTGGLGFYGKIAFSLYLIIIAPYFFIIAGILRQIILTGMGPQELAFVSFIPVYIFISLFVFIAPLYTVRTAMIKSKGKKLEEISEKYYYNYALLNQKKSSNNDNNENKILEKLNGFKQLYEEIDRVPQFPLDAITTKRFLSTLIMSTVAIVPTIWPYIQELSIF